MDLHGDFDEAQKFLEKYIKKNSGAVQEDAVKWRKVGAQKVRHKLPRKQFYRAINEGDIPVPPQFDRSIDGFFTANHDQFRSIAEGLYSWAVCDANKQHELNPLRHSPKRVLGRECSTV